ncbi:AAA family ATPase [Streptomyces sp. NRRL S-244]|uniref:AAA family ATPase n=1 Tax=Streptomyces sp. NRRL S-244 TaxID=1463897 RepID=UPI000996BFBE|nr:AAA family ATPase [Streptomyces sp. NRRL S-244]
MRTEVEKIANQVAHDVFVRWEEASVSRAVRAALAGERADLVREVTEKTGLLAAEAAKKAAGESQERVIARAALRAVEAVLAARRDKDESVVRALAAQSSRDAVLAARPEFVRTVHEEVAKVLADFTPPVVHVTLPARPTVELDADTHRVLPELLLALHARCHVLLVGPAGTGKSMMATHAAQALGLDLQALSLGPTTPMSKVFGYFDAHGHYHDTPFRRAFEHGGVMLLDELDNGHPGLLGELNQALALRTCAFADGMVAAHEDFLLIATANTYGHGGDHQYVGRQALDAATLDRFTVIDVPIDTRLEYRLVLANAPSRPDDARRLLQEVRKLRAVAAEKRLPLAFSPRAGIDGAKLLEAGASLDQALRWRVTRGLSAAHRTALGLDGPEAGRESAS